MHSDAKIFLFLATFFLLMQYVLVHLSQVCYKNVNKQVEEKFGILNWIRCQEKKSETRE